MTQDQAPKSAYEIAMERLKQKDADAGIERQPVTDAQKAAIAEIRSRYDAKLAEQDLLHQGRMRASMDPTDHAASEQEYRRERERLTSERDAKIDKARRA